MNLTLIGRLQTRLFTLIGPLILAFLFAAFSGTHDYWTLFGLMAAVTLTLEVGLYGWLLSYQPRWVTLLLAVAEFFLLKWIMEWPYPLEIRLHTRQALEFYLPAWLLSWLTLQVILPWLKPRWAEDNGEFWLISPKFRPSSWQLWGNFTYRRQAYGLTLALLGLITLPWWIAALLTPDGHHFTGLLLMESGHLQALGQATQATQGYDIYSVAGVIGWVARQTRYPILQIYGITWGLAAMSWLLAIQFWVAKDGLQQAARLLAWGGLPLLLLPASWLIVAALLAWSIVLTPWPSKPTTHNQQSRTNNQRQTIFLALALATLLLWGLAWSRIPSAPLAYLDEGTWQALAWLKQSPPPEATISAPPQLVSLVRAFSGKVVSNEEKGATLRLTSEAECRTVPNLFRHGEVCVVEQSQMNEIRE